MYPIRNVVRRFLCVKNVKRQPLCAFHSIRTRKKPTSVTIATSVTTNHNFAELSSFHPKIEEISNVKFEKVCDETLDSLTEYFEELIENSPNLNSADVTYGNGVLTVALGEPHGTYVINRQSPNKQIWLSSPISGPKRYDYVSEGDYWIYRHDGKSLHDLLQEELGEIVGSSVDLSRCSHSKVCSY